jgi:hypothetical protein
MTARVAGTGGRLCCFTWHLVAVLRAGVYAVALFRGREPGSKHYVDAVVVVRALTRVRVGSGACVEQLVCHPGLPLIASLNSERPAVHVWACGEGELLGLGTAAGDSVNGVWKPPSERRLGGYAHLPLSPISHGP